MSEKEFERYLEEVFEDVLSYDTRFSRENFEIGLLVSRAACMLFKKFGYIPRTITEDPFSRSSYLFGHRIAFVNSDTIPISGGGELLIRPVVVCNTIGVFPMEAEVGDYILFNGRLIQVAWIEYVNGNRSFGIDDIDVELSDNRYMTTDDKSNLLRSTMRGIKKRNAKKDAWADEVDTSAIDDYLSSLTVT